MHYILINNNNEQHEYSWFNAQRTEAVNTCVALAISIDTHPEPYSTAGGKGLIAAETA